MYEDFEENFDEKYYRRERLRYKKNKKGKLKNTKKNRKLEKIIEDGDTFEEIEENKNDGNEYLKSILKPPTMLLIKDKPKEEDESKYSCVIC